MVVMNVVTGSRSRHNAWAMVIAVLCVLIAGMGYQYWRINEIWKCTDAGRRGDARLVREYLDAGMPVNAKDIEGMMALKWACYEGHVDVVRDLGPSDCGDAGWQTQGRHAWHGLGVGSRLAVR
jgi:hypothetical protein